MVSTVTDWIDVPYNEAEIGDNYYGMTGKVGMAIRAALDKVKNNITWSDFDQDNDGEIDAIAIIHSGYGAEAAEPDCYTDLAPESRIWSHKWNLDQDWTAPGTGTLVWKYHISPALWGSCGSNIGRIGVICHETGHFLGAPDIYDGTGGNGTYEKDAYFLLHCAGDYLASSLSLLLCSLTYAKFIFNNKSHPTHHSGVGSWGMMGNSWGFNGDQVRTIPHQHQHRSLPSSFFLSPFLSVYVFHIQTSCLFLYIFPIL